MAHAIDEDDNQLIDDSGNTLTDGGVVSPEIDPDDVIADAAAKIRLCTAGNAITAGMPVCRDSADGRYRRAGSAVAQGKLDGIALNNAFEEQPVTVCTAGEIDCGGVFTRGQVYVLAAESGMFSVPSDLQAGDFVTIAGVAVSNSSFRIGIQQSGVQVS